MVNLPDEIPADWPDTCMQKEFAALIGLSPPAVCKHKAAGRLVMDGCRVKVRESVAKIRANTHPGRGGDRTPGARSTPQRAAQASAARSAAATAPRAAHSAPQADPEAADILFIDDPNNYQLQAAREKRASAQLRELELAQAAGQLVETAARDAAEFGRARMAREAVMSIPDRLAVQLSPETPVDDVHAILTAECRRICTLLATGQNPFLEATP